MFESVIDVGSALAFFGLKEPVKSLGSVIADPIKYFQWSNQLKMLELSKKKFQKLGINSPKVPPGFLCSLLDACQNADESYLQNLWSNLLVNAVNQHPVHPSYVTILKELSFIEANILNNFFDHCEQHLELGKDKGYEIKKSNYDDFFNENFVALSGPSSIKINKESIHTNLLRLQLIVFFAKKENSSETYAKFTTFGVDFIKSMRLIDTNL